LFIVENHASELQPLAQAITAGIIPRYPSLVRTLSPLGQISAARDIAEAVCYLTEASQVTGEVLHVRRPPAFSSGWH